MFYLDLFDALARHGVRHVLVGGLAINLHGVERATMDVDLALAITAANLSRSVDAFEELGLVPVAPVPATEARDPAAFARWRTDKRMIAFGWRPTRAPGPVVDCLTSLPMPFDDLWSRATAKRLGTVDVRVAAIDDLIAMKRFAGREIDRSDIVALERLRALGSGEA